MEPVFEFLQPFVDLTQDALDGGNRRVANRCSVKKKDESCQISRDQYQLVDVFNVHRDQGCGISSGILVAVWFLLRRHRNTLLCCLIGLWKWRVGLRLAAHRSLVYLFKD